MLIRLLIDGLTIVTSVGGAAITLATSGAGVATSFAGSEYTVATAAVNQAVHSNNGAMGGRVAFHLPSSLQLATLVGGVIAGATLVL
jgi:hypothetical protein